MEYLPINNIKQEPTTSASNASNNNQSQAPDSVENKVSRNAAWETLNPLPSCLDYHNSAESNLRLVTMINFAFRSSANVGSFRSFLLFGKRQMFFEISMKFRGTHADPCRMCVQLVKVFVHKTRKISCSTFLIDPNYRFRRDRKACILSDSNAVNLGFSSYTLSRCCHSQSIFIFNRILRSTHATARSPLFILDCLFTISTIKRLVRFKIRLRTTPL